MSAKLHAKRSSRSPRQERGAKPASHIDDPAFWAKFSALSDEVVGADEAPEPVKVKRKPTTNPLTLWKQAQRKGVPVRSMTTAPDGTVTMVFGPSPSDMLDGDDEHIETPDELRALI